MGTTLALRRFWRAPASRPQANKRTRLEIFRKVQLSGEWRKAFMPRTPSDHIWIRTLSLLAFDTSRRISDSKKALVASVKDILASPHSFSTQNNPQTVTRFRRLDLRARSLFWLLQKPLTFHASPFNAAVGFFPQVVTSRRGSATKFYNLLNLSR